jgi:outer membrane lipoprotein-sorting protein
LSTAIVRPPSREYQIVLVALALLLVTACAPKRIELPTAAGVPFPQFHDAYSAATASCAGVRTITAELGMSGHAGRTKLRGRALVGLAAPDAIRLEAVAPFGQPVFILVSRGDDATLLLPRDHRVLRHEKPAAIVDALAGVAIAPAGLRAAIAGCGAPGGAPTDGRRIGEEWAAVDVAGGSVFLQQNAGAWRVRGARLQGLTITYDELGAMWPLRVTLRTTDGTSEVRLSVSQVDANVTLGADAFQVDVPPDAEPLTLQELRDAGPLGEARSKS